MGAALLAFCETTLTKVLMSSLTLQIFIKELKMQTSLLLEKDAWIIRPSLAKHRRRCVSCKTISYSVIAICGSLGENYQHVYDFGIDSAYSIISSPSTLEDVLQNSEQNLLNTATDIARILKLQ